MESVINSDVLGRAAAKYVPNIGKMMAKNNGETFSNGYKFATVAGVFVESIRDNIPHYRFSDVTDLLPCYKCRLAR